jgi:YebC/PmpR family DNA-binding regulatory protein
MGGGDVDANPRLRTAVAGAKAQNMPQDNILRAIKKGTGDLEGVNYEEITYEGYGPGGAAILIESMTDNKNRTVGEVRAILGKNGGNMGESGCVGYLFEKKGLMVVPGDAMDEDALMELVLDAGADDLQNVDGHYEILTAKENFHAVHTLLEEKGIPMEVAELTAIPSNTIPKRQGDVAVDGPAGGPRRRAESLFQFRYHRRSHGGHRSQQLTGQGPVQILKLVTLSLSKGDKIGRIPPSPFTRGSKIIREGTNNHP